MLEIRIYNWRDNGVFERVGITYLASALAYTRSFYGVGEFSFTIPAAARYAPDTHKNSLIEINREFWGLAHSVSYNADSSGDVMTVRGRDLKGLCMRTTIPPQLAQQKGTAGFDAVTGATETVMKHFVSSNFFDTLDPNRKVPGFFIASDQRRGLANDKYMTRFEILSDVMQKVGEAAEVGWDIRPVPNPDGDIAGIWFDVYIGTNRTAGQTDRPPVIFDPARGNVLSMSYENSDQAMKNVFYATMSGAEFEDEALTMTYTRDDAVIPSGISRQEMHMSISADTPVPGGEYEELKRQALITAGDYVTAESFTCEIPEHMKPGGAFELGDYVTVRNQNWGLSLDAQITAFTLEADSGGVRYRAAFGKERISVFGRLARQIRNGG